MKFKNTCKESPLSFECGGTHYDVPIGGVFEVPDRFAFAVTSMGVLCEPFIDDAALEEATKPDPKPSVKPPAKS